MDASGTVRVVGAVALLVSGLLAPLGGSAAAAGGQVPGGEWAVESPESHGMDPVVLDEALQYAFADGRNTQGVVVVHRGAIVAERYDGGADAASPASSWSVAKSFTSSLIGIAIDDGLIPGIDEPMSTYYPEWVGTPREAITLRHVLHMSSGLDWTEDYDPSNAAASDIIQMVATQGDQLAYAAGRPAAVAPGSDFNYSSGDTMLLSGVIEAATGTSAGDYARAELLDPIGIDALDWWSDAEGHSLTYCCIDTTSRDFARFGLLYLNGGDWGGDQVVPADWVEDSIGDAAPTYDGYGYQWWLDLSGAGGLPPYYSARGHDGQYIYVVPSLDLVAVRNGTYVKSPCPAVADPNLFTYLPSDGLVPGQGTVGPDNGWSDRAFLRPIVESLTGPVPDAGIASASAAPDPSQRASGDGVVDATSDCPNQQPPAPTTPTSTVPASTGETATATPAVPVRSTPSYTG